MKIIKIISAAVICSLLGGCIIINVQTDHPSGQEKSKHREKQIIEKREIPGDMNEDKDGDTNEEHEPKEKLKAEARVTEDQARVTALRAVPGSAVRKCEIARDGNHLQWSLNMVKPGEPYPTEVNIDAITGDVISINQEDEDDNSVESAK